MLETIICIGVIWNAVLQTGWFIWSYKIHNRKHLSDDEIEIELFDKLKKHFDDLEDERKRHQNWTDFTPLKTKDEILNTEKKFNPDEIPGAFDTIFKD